MSQPTLRALVNTYQNLKQATQQACDEFWSIHNNMDAYPSKKRYYTELERAYQHKQALSQQKERTAQDVAVRLREELGEVSRNTAGIEYIHHTDPDIGLIRVERVGTWWLLWDFSKRF
ncbi:MAG: hypothetical protein F6J87_18225 [Spirulina sp. SIO3F2]|nr:hypothetical protein [Spirulina sp. SIO3F2]